MFNDATNFEERYAKINLKSTSIKKREIPAVNFSKNGLKKFIFK